MLYDSQHNVALTNKAAIHILELKKWHNTDIKSDLDMWSWFFLNAETMDPDQLPEFLQSNLMERAMDTLKHFKDEKERSRYDARLDFFRSQSSLKQDWEDEREEERKTFQEEIERLKADSEASAANAATAADKRERLLREQLIKAGIDPVL